jgi:nucleotide-binding universal stress UspA family protein
MAGLTVLTVEDPDEATPLAQVRDKTMEIAKQFETKITLAHSVGHPAQVIRDTAIAGYDLLVIGARGLHSVQDFFLGRNAIRLVKNAPISTLVVRKNDTAKRILWRIPRGPINEKHVSLITHIVNTLQADLTLLKVEPSASLFGRHQAAEHCDAIVSDSDNHLNQLRTRLNEVTGREVGCRARTGIPEEVILDEAAIGNYDLVAVSVQPRRGLGKLFSENLPYRVARNIPVSILLLN